MTRGREVESHWSRLNGGADTGLSPNSVQYSFQAKFHIRVNILESGAFVNCGFIFLSEELSRELEEGY